MTSEFAHAMRSAELALAMPLLPAGGRILELGAGDGWQASILTQHGFTVTAIDVEGVAAGSTQYAPVTLYDGRTLPFPDDSFDAVYSSNVLEHIKDFDRIQAELARVLTIEGIAVHCLPSATWRFWTTLGHPFHAARWLWSSRKPLPSPPSSSQASGTRPSLIDKSMLGLLRLGLIAPRHGEHGNLLTEHYLFSRSAWKRRFEQTGWQIQVTRPTGLFYSGNELFGLRLTRQFRGLVARMLGSSTFLLTARAAPSASLSRPLRQTR
ncbi:class I SAM-dependent methyltransferase [Dyella sp. EPa41]|uniref:class I SAM-dependent methyltransferase n=1 Tax=Dyella sp. EPa41 TaxID=1561194 RepID=UPI001915E561|nr:class I SAM-dependent methyltransferase [Dyella sp. EPa41]